MSKWETQLAFRLADSRPTADGVTEADTQPSRLDAEQQSAQQVGELNTLALVEPGDQVPFDIGVPLHRCFDQRGSVRGEIHEGAAAIAGVRLAPHQCLALQAIDRRGNAGTIEGTTAAERVPSASARPSTPSRSGTSAPSWPQHGWMTGTRKKKPLSTGTRRSPRSSVPGSMHRQARAFRKRVLPRCSHRPVDVDDRPVGKAPGLGEIHS